MRASAKRMIDLEGIEDIGLEGHDFVRFRCPDSAWKRIDVREASDGIIINSDIGGPLTVEMVSSNQFVIKWATEKSN
jgi:hypothetical protein